MGEVEEIRKKDRDEFMAKNIWKDGSYIYIRFRPNRPLFWQCDFYNPISLIVIMFV